MAAYLGGSFHWEVQSTNLLSPLLGEFFYLTWVQPLILVAREKKKPPAYLIHFQTPVLLKSFASHSLTTHLMS